MTNTAIETLPTTWSVTMGTRENNELWCDVKFENVTDAQWLQIRQTAQVYETARLPECPHVEISFIDRTFKFRLGSASNPPQLLTDAGVLTSEQVAHLRSRLVDCAEGLHQRNLGFGFLDRRLAWTNGDTHQFVPAFWLSACDSFDASHAGMPPEYTGATSCAPSQPGDIYAIASVCFRALTGNEHDPAKLTFLTDWDAVLAPALQETPSQRPATFAAWKKAGGTAFTKTFSRSRTYSPQFEESFWQTYQKPIVLIGVVLLGCVVLWGGCKMLSAVVRNLPSISLTSSSYKRGTGLDVASYANKSYDRAKWKAVCNVQDLEGFYYFGTISGWDKNNIVVTGYNTSLVATFKNGDWKVIADPTRNYDYAKNARYNGANELLVMLTSRNGSNPCIVRKFTSTKIDYDDTAKLSGHTDGWSFDVQTYQVERDVIVYKTTSASGNTVEIYDFQGDKITQILPNDKRYSVQSKGKQTYITLPGISSVHSYRNGRAIGFYSRYASSFVKYENGQWHEHFEAIPGDVIADIWAIDENNFIAVGSKGITQFRDGKMSHPMVQVKDWQFGDWIRVWGVDLNKYWLLDSKGNIAQIANGQVSGVVHGPDNISFTGAWVSPEGTVFAITGSEVYRLE